MKKSLLTSVIVLLFAVEFISAKGAAQDRAETPNLAQQQPITIKKGDHVTAPRVVRTTNPRMPSNGIRGTVVIQGVVGTDGKLHAPTVKRSLSPQNDASALQTIKDWSFEPAKKDGKPVPVKTAVEVVFF